MMAARLLMSNVVQEPERNNRRKSKEMGLGDMTRKKRRNVHAFSWSDTDNRMAVWALMSMIAMKLEKEGSMQTPP